MRITQNCSPGSVCEDPVPALCSPASFFAKLVSSPENRFESRIGIPRCCVCPQKCNNYLVLVTQCSTNLSVGDGPLLRASCVDLSHFLYSLRLSLRKRAEPQNPILYSCSPTVELSGIGYRPMSDSGHLCRLRGHPADSGRA